MTESQSNTPNEPPIEGIKSELHAIVDNLQLDKPSDEQPQRPLWQRVFLWAVPLWLIVFVLILTYNPKVDNCNGVKIQYRQQTLCISDEKDFFVFVENLSCDFIEQGRTMADSLSADSVASETMKNYFDKYDFSLEREGTETEVLRGMRNARYDSTSFCKNVAVSFWNAGVRLLNAGKTDSACTMFNKLEAWKWRDSVLTAADRAVIKQVCGTNKPDNQPIIPPATPLKPKPRVPTTAFQTPPQPIAPTVNLPINPTKTPSVNGGRRPDLFSVEQANRQNTATTETTDPKAQQAATPIVTTTETVGKTTFDLVLVKSGTFLMGCGDEKDKDCYDNEKPAHSVTVSDFYIGTKEVTQKQWREVMGTSPSSFEKCDKCPVESVSWNDIQAFLKKLNDQTKGKKYRLPTEAEWEFAARGGNNSKGFKYSGGDDIKEVAWYDGNSENKTHPVGTKKANELGIYDMSGNVWEWCSDWFESYNAAAVTNPMGAGKGSLRVFRGGSWFNYPQLCRAANRLHGAPTNRGNNLGFRVVRSSQ